MTKKLIIIFILTFSIFFWNTAEAKIDIDKIYNNFINRIEKENTFKKEIILLENIWKTFEKLEKKYDKKSPIQKFLKKFISLNNKKILEINEKIKTEKIKNMKFHTSLLQKENIKIKHPKYIKYLINKGFELYELNDKFEYKKDSKVLRIKFKEYYSPREINYKVLAKKSKNAKIIYKNNSYYFVEKFEIEEKIFYENAKKYFKEFITKNSRTFLKWNYYYFYDFTNYLSIVDDDGFFISDLTKTGLKMTDTLLYFDDWKYYFVKDYKEIKLINRLIIANIKNKNKFLNILIDDKKFFKDADYEQLFLSLRSYSEKLSERLTKEKKIEYIYAELIKRLKYFVWDYNKNKQVFSGILSFKNTDSVCDWYVKLFSYMLLFSWIEDFEIKKWYVFNSKDFPHIGHAWLKIWDKYYDPTFDDPIWNTKEIKKEDYLYFWLDKELFYTNRFEYKDKESFFEEYKAISLEKRNLIVEKNLFELSEKYRDTNLVKTIFYKKDLWFVAWEKITIEKLKKKMKYFEVKKDYSFIDWKSKKRIIYKIEYFTINDENIWALLMQIKEKFAKSYLLKFEQKNGSFKYYLAFVLEYK